MDTQWLETVGDRLGRTWQIVLARLQSLAEPRRSRQVRLVLYAIATLWMVVALSRLAWSLFPARDPGPPPAEIINPLGSGSAVSAAPAVDIDELVSWNLFGTASQGPTPEELAAAAEAAEAASRPAGGIEENARETKLNLKLQGVVASSDAESARAIIEVNRRQEQYAVGDKLPLSGSVTLAKILADRVVLDNGGKYELLLLFDESKIARTDSKPLADARPASTPPRKLDKRGDATVTRMAESYRKRLYSNPQSLSQVVRIAAVRENGELRGYRVRAGQDRQQFEALGFKPNDIVIGVNGIALTDPGKAMELYRVMRSAEEASFNVLREGDELTLVVGLGGPADSP